MLVIVREKRRFIILHGALMPRVKKKSGASKHNGSEEPMRASICNLTSTVFKNEIAHLIQEKKLPAQADAEKAHPNPQNRNKSFGPEDELILVRDLRTNSQTRSGHEIPSRAVSNSSLNSPTTLHICADRRRMSTPNVNFVTPIRSRSATLCDLRRSGNLTRSSNRSAFLSTMTVIVLLKNLSQIVCGSYYQVNPNVRIESLLLINAGLFQ